MWKYQLLVIAQKEPCKVKLSLEVRGIGQKNWNRTGICTVQFNDQNSYL